MKEGDLVTTYWAGFYEIINIRRRWEWKYGQSTYEKHAYCKEVYDENTCGIEMNPLFELKQIYSKEGKKVNSKQIKSCDSQFCELASIFIPKEIERLNIKIKNLNEIINK